MATKSYTKKTWTAGGCLADHRKVLASLPWILDAYVGPHGIEPDLNESIMVTVNSVNNCPFCEGLHGELARMAGVEDAEKLMHAESLAVCHEVRDHIAITYARCFAECDGRGEDETQAYRALTEVEGSGRARSIRALCWFLLWGSIGGNTIHAFLSRLRGAKRPGSSVLFELIFFVIYGPLFLLIAVVNALLRFFPRVPGWFSKLFGVVLTGIASAWILPVSLLGLACFWTRPRILS